MKLRHLLAAGAAVLVLAPAAPANATTGTDRIVQRCYDRHGDESPVCDRLQRMFAPSNPGSGADKAGNTIGTAKRLLVGSRPTSLVEAGKGGDLDYFRFEVTRTTRLLAVTGGSCSTYAADTYLHLYNSAGQQLTSNDDGGGSYCSRIDRVLSPGRYYLMQRPYDSDGAGTYTYTLTVSLLPVLLT